MSGPAVLHGAVPSWATPALFPYGLLRRAPARGMKITARSREEFEMDFASGSLRRLDLSRLPGRAVPKTKTGQGPESRKEGELLPPLSISPVTEFFSFLPSCGPSTSTPRPLLGPGWEPGSQRTPLILGLVSWWGFTSIFYNVSVHAACLSNRCTFGYS